MNIGRLIRSMVVYIEYSSEGKYIASIELSSFGKFRLSQGTYHLDMAIFHHIAW